MDILRKILITSSQWDQILTDVMDKLPEEACGLLAGTGNQVLEVIPVENIYHSPFRYRMDPQAQLTAFQLMEDRGWDLLAIYHSHPAGQGIPSETDIKEAYYPEAIYMIISGEPDNTRPRGFIIQDEEVNEIPVHIVQAE